MRGFFRYLTLLAALLTLTFVGCIENDLPYPVVKLHITSIDVEGIIGEPVIDESARKVMVELHEQTDIQNVEISGVTYTDKARPSREVVGVHDLRSPLYVTLSLYQDYPWTISATQHIERIFTVEGQIGSTEWDVENRIATAYVGGDDHSNIRVTGLKLAAADISTYEWAEGVDPNDFSSVRYVYVTCHGRTERWDLYVKTTDVVVDIVQADAWGKVMWLYGEGLSGTDLGFRYREAGSDEWLDVEDVKVNGGSFSACVRGLQTLTEYEIMAYSNDDVSAVKRVKTEGVAPLENGGFEDWATIKKIVCPYLTEETAFWGTGNPGAAMVSATVSDKSTDVRPGSTGTYSAMLESKFANMAGIGKFAAGNLFVGKYIATVGTNGIVGFGRRFTARPTALRFWVKYNCGEIDRIGTLPAGSAVQMGDNDTGSVFVALGDWTKEEYGVDADGEIKGTDDTPLIIDTRDKSTFFNPKSSAVIAYGEMLFSETIGEWREVTIPLEYVTTSKVPTHIVIVNSASRLGDYFTGSTQSVLWLDDMELLYE
ncbi:MAG: PCMD domain-containing protein [Alistipes sp.]|nr:PCMD domain-containing protein [Alistipes sp.]